MAQVPFEPFVAFPPKMNEHRIQELCSLLDLGPLVEIGVVSFGYLVLVKAQDSTKPEWNQIENQGSFWLEGYA